MYSKGREEKDNMKKAALMFPGQGSQYINMGKDFLDNNREYRKYFEISSEIIGRDIVDIIHNRSGEGSLLDKTQFSQISIYSLSCAVNDYIMNRMSIRKECLNTVLGHSLGEYSALYSSGMYDDYMQGAKLVACRGKIMGSTGDRIQVMMAAVIGADLDMISDIIDSYKDRVFIANFNDYSQTVISGYREDVKKAASELVQKGARRVIPLKVSTASHCPLMREVSLQLEEFIEDNISFKDPDLRFFSTTKVSYIGKENIKKVLIKQLIEPIRWIDSIEYLLSRNVEIFIEVGPGRVLSGLVKRIAGKNKIKNIKILGTDKWEDIKNLKDVLVEEGIIYEA